MVDKNGYMVPEMMRAIRDTETGRVTPRLQAIEVAPGVFVVVDRDGNSVLVLLRRCFSCAVLISSA